MKQNLHKRSGIFYLIIFILVLFRILWLDKFPVGITHDEMDIITNAKSIWIDKTDSSGTKFPQFLFNNKSEAGQTGLPGLLLAPLIGPFRLNTYYIRAVMVSINLLTILFLYFFVKQISKDNLLAKIVLLFSLINPWLFFYSRLVLDAPLSLFFVVLGMFLLFNLQKRKILFALIPFTLAFLVYFGAQPVVPPLFLLLSIVRYKTSTNGNRKILLKSVIIFLLLLSAVFCISVKYNDSTFNSRLNNLSIFQLEDISSQVNSVRRTSIENPLSYIFVNKATFLQKDFFEKYLGFISVNFLFKSGDPSGAWNFREHGLFYFIDFVFILFGILTIKVNKLNQFSKIILVLFLVAPLSSAIMTGGASYLFRGYLLIIGFIILISTGIRSTFGFTIINKYKNITILLLSVVYTFSFVNFLYFFFATYPVRLSENHFLSERILANYLERNQLVENNVTVATDSPVQVFQQFNFYTDGSGRNISRSGLKEFNIGVIEISANCPDGGVNQTMIYKYNLHCDYPKKGVLVIQNPKDSGGIFYIINDKLCERDKLNYYTVNFRFSDFAVEKLENNKFCEKWLAKID